MRVSLEDVDRAASLSMLTFTPEAKAAIQKDMDAVLGHVERLEELDTTGVEPTSYILRQRNVLRADEPGKRWPQEEMLRNAPEQASGCFAVPRVVE